jgi:steroid delta-isomerase
VAERDALELLDLHVAAFNRGVATGDWNPLPDRFVPDGALFFVGAPVGPFLGREAIDPP